MDQIEIFIASLKRCLAQPEFLLNFYAIFMDSSEEIRQKFAHTDFKRQTGVLAESFWVIAVAAQGPKTSPAWGDLPRIAARHSRSDLDIRPGLYDIWLDCLVEAARKHDRDFSPEIEDAWRKDPAGGHRVHALEVLSGVATTSAKSKSASPTPAASGQRWFAWRWPPHG